MGQAAVFLHLKAELNYHQLFENEIERFSLENLEQKQKGILAASVYKSCVMRLHLS